jgi:hypothetical protein
MTGSVTYIAKALRDPSSLVLLAAVLGALIYSVRRNWPEARRNIRGFVLSVTTVVIAISLYGLNVVRVIHIDRNTQEFERLRQPYALTVVVMGRVTTEAVTEGLPFRVSSGQLNVGCNSTQPAQVSWSIPSGATITSQGAAWQNTDNIRNPRVNGPSPNDNDLIASGSIDGLERTLFGNCPGGGHGELVLSGTYRLSNTQSSDNQLLVSYSGKISRGQLVAIPLPNETHKVPESSKIVVSDASSSTTVDITFAAEGRLTIRNQTVQGTIPVMVEIGEGKLNIQLK